MVELHSLKGAPARRNGVEEPFLFPTGYLVKDAVKGLRDMLSHVVTHPSEPESLLNLCHSSIHGKMTKQIMTPDHNRLSHALR